MASQVVAESVEAIAAHKVTIAKYGCAAAGLSGVVAAALVLIARAFMLIVDRITRERDESDAG